jgi:uncharacterized glyoxalase superfamily protein PhnB
MAPTFNQVNVVVADMAATIAFYKLLGLPIDAQPDAMHVPLRFPNGLLVEFDTVAFAKQWNTGFRGTTGGSTVLGFGVPSRDAVDAIYRTIVEAGYRGMQPPYDAFWGARYAIVEDPDGNGVGLMSPIEDARRFWPPSTPPSL